MNDYETELTSSEISERVLADTESFRDFICISLGLELEIDNEVYPLNFIENKMLLIGLTTFFENPINYKKKQLFDTWFRNIKI